MVGWWPGSETFMPMKPLGVRVYVPIDPVDVLPVCDTGKLAHDLQDVLQSAVDKGGSTLRDFVDPEGQTGYFQHVFNVYGREGEPCHSCESEIVREVLSNRSLFYCRQCQR